MGNAVERELIGSDTYVDSRLMIKDSDVLDIVNARSPLAEALLARIEELPKAAHVFCHSVAECLHALEADPANQELRQILKLALDGIAANSTPRQFAPEAEALLAETRERLSKQTTS